MCADYEDTTNGLEISNLSYDAFNYGGVYTTGECESDLDFIDSHKYAENKETTSLIFLPEFYYWLDAGMSEE